MNYLLFYWIFSSLFAYGYLLDENEKHLIGHHVFMSVLGILFGWITFPLLTGKSINKILRG